MTDWRPTATVRAASNRAEMLRRIRGWFAAKKLLEVDTPALSPYAISDTQIESLEIRHSAVSQRPLFLHTSPEYCMKRLLAAGYPEIYSICRVFRDGESGRQHQPEFTMIEWYRLGFGLREIVEDAVELIDTALDGNQVAKDPVVYDYRDVYIETALVDPFTATIDELVVAASADDALRRSVGNHRDDWLDLILATVVAPSFEKDRLTVLQHYPVSQAALARVCPNNSQTADRFEVFLGASELANGYVELTNPEEQSGRIHSDNAERSRRGRPVRPLDRHFLAALQSGLPSSAGVAMGLERLQMIHDGTDAIQDVVAFAFETDK